MKNIWFTGVPGSRWSGIARLLTTTCQIDQTDETPDRIFYHKQASAKAGPQGGGHIGAYWGPGMGCGEHWTDLSQLTPQKIQADIDAVFTGTDVRLIKNHFLLRHQNLDYINNNFSGDYIFLVYREPQKSFAWWCEVMDFTEEHYPDYRLGYKDYNTMYEYIQRESAYMLDFAIRNDLPWMQANKPGALSVLPTYNADKYYSHEKWNDTYITYQRIT